MKFYVAVNGEKLGPFEEQKLLSNGVTATTLVWCEGMPNWMPAGTIPELSYLFEGMVPPAPTMSQQNNAQPFMPKTWLVESILATLFCCLPFGIVAIVKSTKVQPLFFEGRYEEAREASRSAKKWVILAALSSVIVYILYVVFIAAVGIGAFALDTANF